MHLGIISFLWKMLCKSAAQVVIQDPKSSVSAPEVLILKTPKAQATPAGAPVSIAGMGREPELLPGLGTAVPLAEGTALHRGLQVPCQPPARRERRGSPRGCGGKERPSRILCP